VGVDGEGVGEARGAGVAEGVKRVCGVVEWSVHVITIYLHHSSYLYIHYTNTREKTYLLVSSQSKHTSTTTRPPQHIQRTHRRFATRRSRPQIPHRGSAPRTRRRASTCTPETLKSPRARTMQDHLPRFRPPFCERRPAPAFAFSTLSRMIGRRHGQGGRSRRGKS
jgi:hypothetical protein